MYDAIVIGARCAGSPTAMLLARKGYRVLLLDKASFPSDVISTHVIWPHGCEILDRWGLLEKLARTGCPPVALKMKFDVGPQSSVWSSFAWITALIAMTPSPPGRFSITTGWPHILVKRSA